MGPKQMPHKSFTAPVSGYVIEKNVNRSDAVPGGCCAAFFYHCQPDEVWVMASVFETDIAKIKTGYHAEVM